MTAGTAAVAAFLVGIASNLAQVAILRFFLGEFYGTELHLGMLLALWLFGIAAGGWLSGAWKIPAQSVLLVATVSPVLSILAFLGGSALILPQMTGQYLPFMPVCAVMALAVLPLALPVGALIPSLVVDCSANDASAFDCLFALESAGGAAGGLLFAGLAGGSAETASLMLACLILSGTALTAVLKGHQKLLSATMLLIIPLAASQSGHLQKMMNDFLWRKFHVGYDLAEAFDSPYQSIKIAKYGNQYSLFLDQNLSVTWPDVPLSEQRIHSFLSCVPDKLSGEESRMLLVGIPSPDLLMECLKYRNMRISVADLDERLLKHMQQLSPKDERIEWLTVDPRAYLRRNPGLFDAIIVLSSDPTTLIGNRLFTRDALREAVTALSDTGVLDYSVSGAENYLGGDLSQVVLSLHRDIFAVAGEVVPVPGDPIHFRASRCRNVIATSPRELADRFARRGIRTESFRPELFADIFQPFRVSELRKWLASDAAAPVNTDVRPAALARQLHLWDIYSGSGTRSWLRKIEGIGLWPAIICIIILYIIFSAVVAGNSSGCIHDAACSRIARGIWFFRNRG